MHSLRLITRFDLTVFAEMFLSGDIEDPTPVTISNGESLRLILTEKQLSYNDLAKLLETNSAVFSASHGHVSGIFIAAVCTGHVTEEVSNTVLTQVQALFGISA